MTKSGGAGTSTIAIELDNDGAVGASSGVLQLSGGDGTATQTGSFGGTGAGLVDFMQRPWDLAAGSSFTGRVELVGRDDLDALWARPCRRGRDDDDPVAGAHARPGAGTLLVNGTLVWAFGTQSGSGETQDRRRRGARSQRRSVPTLSARTLRNEGPVDVHGAGSIFAGTGARIVNAPGANVRPPGRQQFLRRVGAPAARFENAGTLKKSGGVGHVDDLDRA